jgi:ectoine hydroxylase-related dioxygenase (phytanoyl-CoA dioxygenase family)
MGTVRSGVRVTAGADVRAGTTGSALLSPEALRLTLRTLSDAGMVVVENVYDLARVGVLRDSYEALLAAERSNADTRTVQPTDGANHIQMQMPLVAPFSDVDVVAHPVVAQIVAAVLGNDFRCSLYNSNTALPGSTPQRVHRDSGPVFGTELAVPTPTTGLVVNIPLCEFTQENGSTEVWPASHLIVDTPEDTLDRVGSHSPDLTARSEALASTRLDLPVGAVAIRDLRLWHRGMPNESEAARSMLALVYQRSWLSWRAASLRVPERTWSGWPEHVRTIFAAAPRDGGTDTENGRAVT